MAVYVDRKLIGTVGNRETKVFEVPTGTHQLTARIARYGSREITFVVKEDENKNLKISAYKYANAINYTGIAIVLSHLIVKLSTGFRYTILLIIPFILVYFYNLTFGRNDYLRVVEVDSWDV